MDVPTTPLIVSVMFCLDTEQGHIFTYNKCVGESARLLDWNHAAAVRAAARVTRLPEGWELCLGVKNTRFKRGLLSKTEKMFRLVASLATYLRHQTRQHTRPLILFLEWFDPIHLIAFCLALMAVPARENLWVWILYRLAIHSPTQHLFYRSIHAVLQRLLPAGRLRLLSDSTVVADELTSSFRETVNVVPIPHGAISEGETAALPAWALSPARNGKLVCWWPGQPAAAKGLRHIQRLAASKDDVASRICLVAAQQSNLHPVEGGCEIILVPDALTREEYLGWMQTTDIVILPYDPAVYKERTSGIFCEAISAGKLVAVHSGTWMARELLAYHLDELIVDWERPDLTQTLLTLSTDNGVRARLAAMQAAYQRIHTRQGFAEALRRVYTLDA